MKCEVAQEWMVMLAYDELAETDAAELEMHVRFCEACTADMERLSLFQRAMAVETMDEPSANLLAESRMRLDARLDEVGVGGWMDRVRALVMGSLATVSSAPALATLLVGVGFLGGNFLERYQAAHAAKMPNVVVMQNQTEGVVSNVSGIVQTPNSDIVQVKYNRVVPETMQGSLDDPQIRQLLMVGAKNGISNGVRENSVSLLAAECIAGHQCESASSGGVGVRDALLVSLRYDKSPKVRMKALEGLQPYVGADQRVRDAVAESLMRDASADVRTRAIDLLQPVQADSSIRQVLHTVSTRDDNPYIRNASTMALEGTDGLQ
jgi:HEAT repeats